MSDELYKRLRPYVRAVVILALRRWPHGRIGVMDVDDLTNEILGAFLGDDGRELKKWDESRGSLENYVSLYARARVLDHERKEMRRLDLFGRPTGLEDTAEPAGGERPDELVIAKRNAKAIVECVQGSFGTELGRLMIDLLLVWQVSTDEAVERTGKTRAQIFRWRSRLLGQARKCWTELFGEKEEP